LPVAEQCAAVAEACIPVVEQYAAMAVVVARFAATQRVTMAAEHVPAHHKVPLSIAAVAVADMLPVAVVVDTPVAAVAANTGNDRRCIKQRIVHEKRRSLPAPPFCVCEVIFQGRSQMQALTYGVDATLPEETVLSRELDGRHSAVTRCKLSSRLSGDRLMDECYGIRSLTA
jgi:hypothetical protein